MAFVNASDVYFGTYARFSTVDKKNGARLAGPDNPVGDLGTIELEVDENKREVAWLKNRYGMRIGKLDEAMSYQMAVLKAKGWNVLYVLSFAAFTDQPNSADSFYWGEVALLSISPRVAKEFMGFLNAFCAQAKEGERPNPALSDAEVNQILAGAKWTSSQKVPLPAMDTNTILIKAARTMHDKLLDKSRSKNPGCYAISWAFIALLGAAAAWLVHSCGII